MKYDISKFDPCKDAVEFYKGFNTFEEAWNACERGDWMLWIAQQMGVELQPLTLAKGLCANTVRHLMKDERSTNAVDVAIKFGKGEATREELDDAAEASYVVACAADAADAVAYDAADAVAYAAADAAYDAAYAAADAAAYAADAAAYAADAAAYAAADAAAEGTNAADAAAYAAACAAACAADAAAEGTNAAHAAAYAANQKQTADICREVLTSHVFKLI